ncbi:hypothetical protein HYALB_00000567, partial [Hymenoscyphus albidus]
CKNNPDSKDCKNDGDSKKYGGSSFSEGERNSYNKGKLSPSLTGKVSPGIQDLHPSQNKPLTTTTTTPKGLKPPEDRLRSGPGLSKRSGTSVLAATKTIALGKSFDGGMFQFDRGTRCTEGKFRGMDAVSSFQEGASLSNVIIGLNQEDGVYWQGADVSDITCINRGKFYRACENYDGDFTRHVKLSGISATNGKVLVGINRTPETPPPITTPSSPASEH